MKVLIVEPGQYPREADIEPTLEAKQKIVGGLIDVAYRETCWYIHLTVASFPELSQKLDRAFVGIIPVGGETDEEN